MEMDRRHGPLIASKVRLPRAADRGLSQSIGALEKGLQMGEGVYVLIAFLGGMWIMLR